ncbi:MAG: DUF3990 domain-containing protein [Muribaculaceae bacterium]|nr:DUF3990 domain-containing protein [Muribaculaceae bacterium]
MKNSDGIIEVYHAGTEIIKSPDCKFGRKDLDFGHGFYLTDIYDQAINFAHARAKDRKMSAIINVYLLDKDSLLREARSLIFNSYNDKWLDFIVACRSGKEVWRDYDYIEGGVADDRVINTVNLFMQGVLSKPEALRRLHYMKPNNQICILNQELLNKHLQFTNSLTLSKDGSL